MASRVQNADSCLEMDLFYWMILSCMQNATNKLQLGSSNGLHSSLDCHIGTHVEFKPHSSDLG